VAIPLAAGVLAPFGITLSPEVGAILMSASTVVVAVNAQLLRRLDLRLPPVEPSGPVVGTARLPGEPAESGPREPTPSQR